MDIEILREGINDLEQSETNVRNVRDLAALYIVLDHLLSDDPAKKELDDIFPCYVQYVNVKTKYQTKNASTVELSRAMSDLCREISEFIQTLYIHSEIAAEREKIHSLVTTLQTVIT